MGTWVLVIISFFCGGLFFHFVRVEEERKRKETEKKQIQEGQEMEHSDGIQKPKTEPSAFQDVQCLKNVIIQKDIELQRILVRLSELANIIGENIVMKPKI